MKDPTITFTYVDEDDWEEEVELPAHYEVCWRCRGKGQHVNPSVDGHGITAEEWANDWDPEEREGYFRGDYDVTCEECGGERVLLEVDEERCDPKLLRQYREWMQSERRARRSERHDYNMGY